MQLKNLDLTLKVTFLIANFKEELTDNEQPTILETFLQDNLYLPEYQSKGEINGKEYEIKFIFDRPSTKILSLSIDDLK